MGDVLVADGDSGLLQLLGGHNAEPARRVHQFVADTAVGVLVAKFNAEAVWLATAELSGPVSRVAAHLPPSWSHTSPVSIEITGRLWAALTGEAGYYQTSFEDEYLWVCSQVAQRSFAVAMVRKDPFDAFEQRTLSRFLRSVSVAIGGGRSGATEMDIAVSAQANNQQTTAEVTISSGGQQRRARADAGSAPLATAKAAVKLCDVRCAVAYAGQVSLGQCSVDMVVVLDENDAPLIGLSVMPGVDAAGPARAVFASLASVSGQPLG